MKSYTIIQSAQFKRDLRTSAKKGLDMSLLTTVIGILAIGRRLDAKYRDHALKGNHKGQRECHIAPDWLLIYEKIDNVLTLKLIRTGTHRDVGFEK